MTGQWVHLAFQLSLLIFMIGNLFSMGLEINFVEAIMPLRNLRFVLTTLIGGFLLGPVLGWLVVLAVPMEAPYAAGLLLLSMAPAAPFLPLVVRKADADLPAAAGFMLLASLGTIVVMPFGVPLVAAGLSANPWSVARPLIFMVLLPLALGMAVKAPSAAIAARLYRYVKSITVVGTLAFLILVLLMNFRSCIGSVGSHALLAQLVYVPALMVVGYFLAAGLPLRVRSVVSLGLGTRNIGAAAAIVGVGGDQRTMVMLVFATVVTLLGSFVAAPFLARRSHHAPPGHRRESALRA